MTQRGELSSLPNAAHVHHGKPSLIQPRIRVEYGFGIPVTRTLRGSRPAFAEAASRRQV